MKNNLKVSIITVCYNSAGYIEEAIKSVLKQTYDNIEYIIVDGKSTDRTLSVINEYKEKISRIISEPDKGIYDAMNKGIRYATGDIIYFLNADDRLYDANVISDIADRFFKDNSIELLYGKVKPVDVPKELSNIKKIYQPTIIKKKTDFLRNSICHQAIFAKKDVFNKVGVFNINYKIYADYDWLLRVFNANIKMQFYDRFIAYYYYQGKSYYSRNNYTKEKLAVIRNNFDIWSYGYYILRFVYLRDIAKYFIGRN